MGDIIYAIVVVFLIGATPWLELWIAIPAGIAIGLNPVTTFFVAIIGNFLPLIAIVLTYRRAQVWFKRHFSPEAASSSSSSGRRRRFTKMWDRYGLPVVSLAAPLIIGTHLTAILAMIGGSSRRSVLLWMMVSLVLWGVATSIASFYGIEYFRSVFSLAFSMTWLYYESDMSVIPVMPYRYVLRHLSDTLQSYCA